MKRLLPILAMALLSLSACDSGALVSPLAPEVGEPSFAKLQLPLFEPPEVCPDGKVCLVEPVLMERERGAPTVAVAEFEKGDFGDAILVVQVSDPKTTTVKAWLNGVTVLLPSAIPQSGENPVSVNLTLAEENLLEVRLSAKPGNSAVFWVEGEVVAPTEPEDPAPSVVFDVTEAVAAPGDDMNAACVAEFGADFGIADWNDVVAEVERVGDASTVPVDAFAWITRNGTGIIPGSFGLPDRHYLLSAIGNIYAVDPLAEPVLIEPDLFWLNATSGDQPVLCISTSEGSS